MKWLVLLSFTVLLFGQSFSLSSINSQSIKFYEEAKTENFNENELEILKPLIDVLQLQYNTISASLGPSSKKLKTPINDMDDNQSFLELNAVLRSIQPEFSLFDEEGYDYQYNISLPNLNNLNGLHAKGLSSDEANDIQEIFQENIDDVRQEIQQLIELSSETERQLISINKVKIVKFIYKMVQKVYALGIRGGRTAYCTYSSVPAINATLREGNRDIGSCYNYTETSVVQLRNDVKSAITDIHGNVQELIDIYRKLAKRHSLLGKLLTVVLNVQKVAKDIKETRSIAIEIIEEVKTDGPIIVLKVKECASTSIPNFVKKLNETITDLNTCYNFEDDSTPGPVPEPEGSEESWEILP